MSEARRCPHCGSEMPAGAPEGVCPRCVLRLGWPGSAAAGAPATTPYRPGAKLIPPTPAELAPYFAPLEILELVGQGGMGAVYKVRQPKLDRLAALKILPGEAVAEDRTFAERFRREAQTLARLNHPGIVGVYDFGEAGGLYYFLMEYVDGVNLRQMLRDGSLRPHEALAIVPQICEALQYAHDEGVVHRDIKPENILVDKKGRVKIADFGLAKLLGQAPRPTSLTGSQQVMGTPNYMSPEQVERPQAVDHRTDIYSLGVVFYELLTGELPLGRFALPSQKVQVDMRLDQVVLRSLEKEPERRYQRAGDVKTEVENITRAPQAGGEQPARWPKLAPEDLICLSGCVLGFCLIGLGMALTGTIWPLWGLPLVVMVGTFDPATKKVLHELGIAGTILGTLGLVIFGVWLTNSGDPLWALFAPLAALFPLIHYENMNKQARKAAKRKAPGEPK